MFYLKVLANLIGMLALLLSIGWFNMPPGGAALVAVAEMAWGAGLLAACVRHWTRRTA